MLAEPTRPFAHLPLPTPLPAPSLRPGVGTMVLDVSRVGGSNARAASGAFHCSSASLPDVSDEEHGRPGWDAGWRLAYGQGLRFGGSLPLAVAILACFVYSLAFDRISCTMLFCRKTVFYNNYGNACSANVQRGSRSPAAA